ncbi:MAG TPA: TolC family protein [Longimicrobiaceae bacterium]|nr:TolC family protein [Longimicrobiaceae bacterium]
MTAASVTPTPGRKRRAGGLALLVALTLVPGAALGQGAPAQQGAVPETLTLEEALATARQNNPDFLAQQNDRRSARAAVRSARADFLPSAMVSNSFGYTAAGERRLGSVALRQGEPAYYASSYSVGMQYDLNGAKLLQPRITRAQERAVEQRIAGAEANLNAQVVQQYLSVLQAQEQVAQAEREVGRTEEHRRLAQARFDVGAGTPLDVRRAEVQKGQAEVALVQARNTLAIATLQLGQLMGVNLQPGVRLASEFAVFQPRWEADALVAQATQNNPDLRAARAQAGAARTGVSAARSSYLPSLNLNVGWNGSVYRAGNIDPLVSRQIQGAQERLEGCHQGNALARLLNQPQQDCSQFNFTEAAIRAQVREQNSGYPFDYNRQPMSAELTVSLPLFTGLSRHQRVAEARVNAEDAAYAVRAQENRLRVEVSTTLRNLETAYQTAQLQEQVVRTAEEELRLARERFRFGAASSVEVTDAQTSLAQAERARLDAVYNFHKSLAAMEALVGQSLR